MRLRVPGGWLYRWNESITFVPENTSWANLTTDIERHAERIHEILDRMEKTIELAVYSEPGAPDR
jgi:hypothetical protein